MRSGCCVGRPPSSGLPRTPIPATCSPRRPSPLRGAPDHARLVLAFVGLPCPDVRILRASRSLRRRPSAGLRIVRSGCWHRDPSATHGAKRPIRPSAPSPARRRTVARRQQDRRMSGFHRRAPVDRYVTQGRLGEPGVLIRHLVGRRGPGHALRPDSGERAAWRRPRAVLQRQCGRRHAVRLQTRGGPHNRCAELRVLR